MQKHPTTPQSTRGTVHHGSMMTSPTTPSSVTGGIAVAIDGSLHGNNNTASTLSSPAQKRSLQRQRSHRYDAASAMDRMRSSMIGSQADAYQSLSDKLEQEQQIQQSFHGSDTASSSHHSSPYLNNNNYNGYTKKTFIQQLQSGAGQIPAILLIGMFHLMIGIPFGVSYFPIGWSQQGTTEEMNTDDTVHGNFPLPGKEALGIRMFLFATMIGQIIFTFHSGFNNPIGLQMVENVPFCHALSQIVIARQGYGVEALSTILILFGLSSILVGAVFLILGKMDLGRVVYYFPNHVLVGCIAGIGVFLAKTGMEVTMDSELKNISQHLNLIIVVLIFEVILRLLDRYLRDKETGKPLYSLLSPIYFCCMTPMFYIGIYISGIDIQDARDEGYFFPSLIDDEFSSTSNFIWNEDLIDMWRVLDFTVISWEAIFDSIPTMIALVLFSLIHVPINIPAFALSTNTEVDMNVELIAHGYSNLLSGACFGLQNYMAYTQSVIYDKSGGRGKISGIVVAAATAGLYFVGPTVASYIPRCMAGTLLLHVGIDLFLEGVYDSYSKFDRLEYGSVLLIIIVMTLYGMDAAMLAGVLSAIFTFVAQNMTYIDPIRGSMSAATLRSSKRNRNPKARAILDSGGARSRIFVIQLQGHLFFGNMAHLTKRIHDLLEEERPVIVIIDFSLVLGIDSSAAMAITKIKNVMKNQYDVALSIFVSGSTSGFPTAFDLSKELVAQKQATATTDASSSGTNGNHQNQQQQHHHPFEVTPSETTGLLLDIPHISAFSPHLEEVEAMMLCGSHVSEDLDMALIHAENFLVARQDPRLLLDDGGMTTSASLRMLQRTSSLADEKEVALKYLKNLCVKDDDGKNARETARLLRQLFVKFTRETYVEGNFVWRQGSISSTIKLLVRGTLIAELENEAGTSEVIETGNSIGEMGFIEGVPRMSSVRCVSEDAVLYSLNRESYDELLKESPHAVRLLDVICIRYLSARVQHVSNRIFETRCLPI